MKNYSDFRLNESIAGPLVATIAAAGLVGIAAVFSRAMYKLYQRQVEAQEKLNHLIQYNTDGINAAQTIEQLKDELVEIAKQKSKLSTNVEAEKKKVEAKINKAAPEIRKRINQRIDKIKDKILPPKK